MILTWISARPRSPSGKTRSARTLRHESWHSTRFLGASWKVQILAPMVGVGVGVGVTTRRTRTLQARCAPRAQLRARERRTARHTAKTW